MLAFIQRPRVVPLISGQEIADNAYWAGSHQHGSINTNCDCRGFNYAMICFHLGTSDIAVAELSLYESDTTTSGDFVIVTGSNYATSPLTLPSANDDGKTFWWGVDLRIRRRFLRINAKAGDGVAGSYATAIALLYRAEEVPSSATDMNVGNIVYI